MTKCHEGKATRVVPMFPELHLYLDQSFEQAEPGTEYVITRYRSTEQNLSTQLHRILRQAGIEPWPSAFNSLRSTRQIELEEIYPRHVVCTWLGNSESIAGKYYLQVTEDHFKKSLHNRIQQSAEMGRTAPQTNSVLNKKNGFDEFAAPCKAMQIAPVEDRGLEPLTFWLPARRSPN